MSQENVEIVCEALARFSERDFERTLELIGEDALWEPSGQFVGSDGGYPGHRGIRRFWDAFTEPWAEIELKPIEAVAVDTERVLTHTHFHGVGRASGIPTDMSVVQLWTVTGGKIRRFQSFATRREALEAVGLSAQDAHADS